MDFMFNDPAMLDDLDFLYKSDNARKILFYYQPEENKEDEEEKLAIRKMRTQRNITTMQKKDEERKPAKKILFTTDGSKVGPLMTIFDVILCDENCDVVNACQRSL